MMLWKRYLECRLEFNSSSSTGVEEVVRDEVLEENVSIQFDPISTPVAPVAECTSPEPIIDEGNFAQDNVDIEGDGLLELVKEAQNVLADNFESVPIVQEAPTKAALSPAIISSPQQVKADQPPPITPALPTDPNVAILQQQISALQTQLLNMASFAMTSQHQIPQSYFYPGMMYKPSVSVPTRDASTSPIPYQKPIMINGEVQTDPNPPKSAKEIGIQTYFEEMESPAELILENNDTKQEGSSLDGKNIIVGLVENAEQSFIFTDKSEEGESMFTSPATSIFSQPKPTIVKRIPFSRLRGNTTITEESFSRAELPTFDDASLSFATTKYLEKYGLSP